jgi:SAM-dependent methyltransferase
VVRGVSDGTARWQDRLKDVLGTRGTVWWRVVTRGLGLARWGNLRRPWPFSTNFGFDRGTPVDRFYLHRFLDAHRADITGDVIEIQQSGYTRRYGQHLRDTHSVDIDPTERPTFVCDLAASDGVIPDARYDCFLLPNTLSVFRDLEGCLRQAWRVLRPGGVLLGAGATFVPLTPDYPDFWHLSADGWREIAQRVWPDAELEIVSHGNVTAAIASLHGLAAEELHETELLATDPRYPVCVTIRARKPRVGS